MDHFHHIFSYCKYLFKAKNEHSLHSPFVYTLFQQVINSEQEFYFFSGAEKLREQLLNDKRKIVKNEFGTGTKDNQEQLVCNIAKKSMKPTKQAQFLFKLVNYFQPKNILELGTSLGLTTAYLAAANSNAKVYSIEGCKNTLEIAHENFEHLNIKNIDTICGNINQILGEVLKEMSTLDFVFFDGNHRYQSTIEYFEMCCTKANSQSVFVFDDIYWSVEMTKAWNEIKQHQSVSVSIDLFCMGILFFRTEQAKQHFVLRF